MNRNVPMTKIRPFFYLIVSFFITSVFLMSPQPSVAQTLSMDKLQQFEEAILRGEDFLQAKEYAKAKAEYQKALSIDPSAKYPKDKLTQIRKFYIDPADEAAFADAMNRANNLMQSRSYAAARDQFSIALNIKPENKAARDKMAEAERLAKAQQEIQKQYTQQIAEADKLYASGNMSGAREAYHQASETNPTEGYPKQRISEIDSKAASEKALKDSYEKILSEGDDAYMDRDFNKARLKYEQALKIKPGENYPKSMLERVSEGMAQMKDAQQNYQSAIASADRLFGEKDYETAMSAYQNASKILPGEKYPSEQMDKIRGLLDQKFKLEEDYNKAITDGDQLLADAKYTEARSEFQKANNLKPGELYPKQKIEEIALQLLEIKEAERNKAYQETIAKADNHFDENNFADALKTYDEAAKIKPEETWPAERISIINKSLQAQKSALEAYHQAIAEADRLFAANNYEQAKSEYTRAQGLNQEETYPGTQIEKIENLIAEQKQKEANYLKAIAEADQLFAAEKFNEAQINYNSALTIKPDNQYPKDQIALIQATLNEQRSKEDQYAGLIGEADQMFASGNLESASNSYNKALQIKPGEKYPEEKIALILKTLEEQRIQRENYTKTIENADNLFNAGKYDQALAAYNQANLILPSEAYPNERITQITKILEDLKSLEENYTRYVAEGDKAFKEKQYQQARSAYTQSLNLKPGEKYPTSQIALADKALEAEMALMGSYRKGIAEADALFASGKLNEASSAYAEFLKLKPEEKYPSEQIEKIKSMLAEQKENEQNYNKAINEGDRLLAAKDYRTAQTKYNEALSIKPGEQYPSEKITEIRKILGEQEQMEQQYNAAIALGDEKFSQNLLDEAEAAYNQANKLNPAEKYPANQLKLISEKRETEKVLAANFSNSIAEGDVSFNAKEYASALVSYQKALGYRPGAEHPTNRISEINNILFEQKQLADKGYYEAIDQADRLFADKDYNSAVRFYENASALKPSENYPKEKILSIRTILQERARNQMEAYNKLIMNADRLYQDKVFDQAIDAYNEASNAKPDEVYPGEMILKIRKYLEDHSIVDLVSSATSIEIDTEKRFNFTPIEMRLRKNNYISIKARKTSETDPKVYVNYGKGSQKNGGIVLRSVTSDENGDFLVRVSIQDRWYREDNNWIGIYTEGGSIEISKMQIAQGD
ncbi:MAG: hypothetical protein K0B15_13760 [Lentimicrobium sp.]|nr:hypothetical protein [Lentimicrobium sp.]